MRSILFRIAIAGAAMGVATGAIAQQPAANAGPGQSGGQAGGQGYGRSRGMGGFPGGGRGVLGKVTEAAADHYTVKTESGEVYTVHFSVNTRIVKQRPGANSGQGPGRRQAGGSAEPGGGEPRQPPQAIKPNEIKVGDFITAGGEMDEAGKSIGAVFIALVDPERAKEMAERQASFGKTWLAGRITAIQGATITIEGIADHAPHTIAVDENTSFRKRRDSITLADIQPGEGLEAEGAVKDGVFLATQVNATEMRERDRASGPAPAGAAAAPAKPQ